MARDTYASYVKHGVQPIGGAHNREPDRQALKISYDGPYFKNGKMNRDPMTEPSGPAVVPSEAREVHIYHHKDKDD